ncbi:MAG: replicative DNA helicase [Acidobacteriota bacterium]
MAQEPAGRESGTHPRIDEILSQQSLPANLEAEKALLGAILMNNDLFEEVHEELSASDFAFPPHRRIYSAFMDLREQNQPLDLVTVTEWLHRRGELEAVGGAEFVAELLSGIPKLTSALSYAKILKDRSLLRQLIQRSSKIIMEAYSSSDEPENILAQAEQSILEVGDQTLRSTLRSMKELNPIAAEMLEKLMQRGEHVTGVPTNFRTLDAMTSGLQSSDFIILAARPSVGKTAFALQLALSAAKQGRSVAVFSLEMSAEQLFFRLLSMESRVDLQKIRTGQIPRHSRADVVMKMDYLATLPIFIDDSPLLTSLDIAAKLRRLKTKNPLDLVIIDYLQLMRTVGRFENRNQEVASISRNMKALAKDMRVPVLALSQLSRASEKRGEGKEPLLSDLRDSGSLEQDADLVLFLHRNTAARDGDSEARARAKLIIAKQRNGPTGIVDLIFLEHIAGFGDSYLGGAEGESPQ